jgi:hypothetical protein
MGPDGLIVALIYQAIRRGFAHVRTTTSISGDVFVTCDHHRWILPSPVVRFRVDRRQLEGPRAEIYVAELVRMMELGRTSEWGARAEWIARLLPLHPVLPAGPPPPKQLPAATFNGLTFPVRAAAGQLRITSLAVLPPPPPVDAVADPMRARGTRLEGLAEMFGVVARAPTPPEGIAFATFGPPLIRAAVISILLQQEQERARLAAELEAVEEMLAEYHAELARDLLAGGRRPMRQVVDLMLRTGLSVEHVARALRTMDEQDAEEEPDELEVRVAELLEQGRSP